MNSQHIHGVIKKLKDWKEYSFHADRQLADEVLIADGWKCEPNSDWEGGVRWYLPGNPEYSTSESGRPHVIHDLNKALGVVPRCHNVQLSITAALGAGARVWANGAGTKHQCTAVAPIATVAVLIAALTAKLQLLEAAQCA